MEHTPSALSVEGQAGGAVVAALAVIVVSKKVGREEDEMKF